MKATHLALEASGGRKELASALARKNTLHVATGNAASHSPGPPPPFFEQMIFQLSERAQLRHPRPQRSMEEDWSKLRGHDRPGRLPCRFKTPGRHARTGPTLE